MSKRKYSSKIIPNRYGNPVKQSVKLITTEKEKTDLNKAALEAYRIKLATFKTEVNKPVETKLGLLEKHLFRRKFESEALDITKTWNAARRVPLHFDDISTEDQNKTEEH